LHAVKNLELAKCVDHLQDENNKLREVLSWLSRQEPQLGMMIASYKRFDGWALGSVKFSESSGEREGNFGNVPVPPQPTHKFASKPNQLLKLREKPSDKASEKPSEKPSKNPCEEPHPKPKPRPIRFHCEYCGKNGHKREFCYKRRREARMAKEWANKNRYHLSHGVPEPRMPLPKGKGVVHTVQAWRDRRASGEGKFAGRGPPARPVRPVLGRVLESLVFVAVMLEGSALSVVEQMVGTLSLVALSLLDVLHLVINTSLGEVATLSLRGATDHGFSFVVLVLLQ
jgi:hypothetical protein